MPDFPALSRSETQMEEMPVPKPVQYQNKGGLVQYQKCSAFSNTDVNLVFLKNCSGPASGTPSCHIQARTGQAQKRASNQHLSFTPA